MYLYVSVENNTSAATSVFVKPTYFAEITPCWADSKSLGLQSRVCYRLDALPVPNQQCISNEVASRHKTLSLRFNSHFLSR